MSEHERERLSSLESDVHHLDTRIAGLARAMDDGFSSIRRDIQSNRQPITAFAGWATVILALVFAFGAPLQSADIRLRGRVDLLEQRELEDAYSRGSSDEKFNTLKEEIGAAIQNRKDIDAKHLSAQTALSSRIDEVAHGLDNGLGRRISELLAPLQEQLNALNRQVFGDENT